MSERTNEESFVRSFVRSSSRWQPPTVGSTSVSSFFLLSRSCSQLLACYQPTPFAVAENADGLQLPHTYPILSYPTIQYFPSLLTHSLTRLLSSNASKLRNKIRTYERGFPLHSFARQWNFLRFHSSSLFAKEADSLQARIRPMDDHFDVTLHFSTK